MRNNYYDSPWRWEPKGGEEKEDEKSPVKPPVPAPYGEAPIPSPEGPVRVFTSQEQLGYTPELRQKKPQPIRRRKKTGVPGFVACLLLLLGLAGGAVYLQGGIDLGSFGTSGFQDVWDAVEDWSQRDNWQKGDDLPGQQDPDQWGFSPIEDDDWMKALKDTAIQTAPTGDGTTLSLSEAGDGLTPQAIYEKLSPSIVGIRVSVDLGYNLGTGVIMSEDGYIITNAHVIAGGKTADVLFADDSRRGAYLVGYDSEHDLAVLKVKASGLPAAEFGDSDTLLVGDPAWAIGNPLGEELRGTFTDGMVSAINRDVGADNGTMTLIQTTAALNSGNSGGALINAAGQVVGITNMKMMSDEETIEGLGFAIPTRAVKRVVDEIIEKGFYQGSPLLGITVRTNFDEKGEPAGAYIVSVEPKSDAYAQGLRPGHIIVRANGQEVRTTEDLLAAKADLTFGDTLVMEVTTLRGTHTVTVKLMSRRDMES